MPCQLLLQTIDVQQFGAENRNNATLVRQVAAPAWNIGEMICARTHYIFYYEIDKSSMCKGIQMLLLGVFHLFTEPLA